MTLIALSSCSCRAGKNLTGPAYVSQLANKAVIFVIHILSNKLESREIPMMAYRAIYLSLI